MAGDERVLRSTGSEIEAEILVSRLKAAGIPAYVRPTHGYLPQALAGASSPSLREVIVRERDFQVARGLVPLQSGKEVPKRRASSDLALLLPWIAIGLAALLRALGRPRRG
jgi:hypothetical protein